MIEGLGRVREQIPILTVARRYQKRLHLRPQGREYVGRCPFHDDRGRPNFYVIPESNFAFCFVCRTYANAASLTARMEHITYAEAVARLLSEHLPVPEVRIEESTPLWEPGQRDLGYRILLGSLSLSNDHREDLLARGLAPEAIEAGAYRTLPDREKRKAAVGALAESLGDLTGLPGLYKTERGTWTLGGLPGLLIPVRDAEGRIVALQNRAVLDGERAYTWVSSASRASGVSIGAQAHVARPLYQRPGDEAVYITEGALKADVVASRLGRTAIAVPGFALFGRALLVVDALRPKRAIIAFDQDAAEETALRVGEAARTLGLQLLEREIHPSFAAWEAGKGIDDALLLGSPFRYTIW